MHQIILACIWIFGIITGCYGIYLTFSASVIMGVICLFLTQPVFFISGFLQLFFDYNLPQKVLEFISKF